MKDIITEFLNEENINEEKKPFKIEVGKTYTAPTGEHVTVKELWVNVDYKGVARTIAKYTYTAPGKAAETEVNSIEDLVDMLT